MTCGIYLIENKKTGQKYIGLSKDIEDRWYRHIHRPNLKKSRIDRAIRKHGADKFNLEIIEELPYDKPLLAEREKYWIAHYNSHEDESHYNSTYGGELPYAKKGWHHTDAIKEKISQRTKGINNPMYGKHHTIESRKKMSEIAKGRYVGKNNPKAKYTLWDNTKCYYNKHDMFKYKIKPRPRKVFSLKYNTQIIRIGGFIDFFTCELLHDLIKKEDIYVSN